MGRVVAVVGALLATSILAPVAPVAAAQKPPSAAEVAAAQKRANAAAARLSKARGTLVRAEREVASLKARTESARHVVSSLEGQVRELAVRQYVSAGQQATWVGGADLGQAARGRAMLRFLSLGRTDAVEGYRVARADLEDGEAALAQQLARQQAAVEALRKDESRISGELRHLAVAYRAEQARLAKLAAEKAAARRAADARARRPARNAGVGLPLVIGSGEWICPVQGPRAFSNDWGQPRSGGRTHQGNDIMAPRGTPIVANVAGSVKGHSSSLGGISYYLRGADGHTYFGTHLDRLSGASGNVAAGTVIGYVGSSGNASPGAPHLHFEIHPGGGRAVNPYPTLSRYC